MSAIQEFKDAPVGATATAPNGNIAVKTGRSMFMWTIYDSLGKLCDNLDSHEMVLYTLVPTAPTTAREALDLAWNLAHPIKEGQFIPEGVRYVRRSQDGGLVTLTAAGDWTPDPRHRDGVRTLDPPPETEPDWLDAPAVIAYVKGRVGDPQVFSRENEDGTQWLRDTRVYRWDELTGVTPLYPEGEKE